MTSDVGDVLLRAALCGVIEFDQAEAILGAFVEHEGGACELHREWLTDDQQEALDRVDRWNRGERCRS